MSVRASFWWLFSDHPVLKTKVLLYGPIHHSICTGVPFLNITRYHPISTLSIARGNLAKMNLNPNETMFRSITTLNETTSRYLVCIDAPPHIVSDGLWGGGKNGRTPMKSFLPLFELQVLLIFAITQICRLLLKPLGLPIFISQMMAGLILQACFVLEPLGTYMRMLFPYGTHDTISTVSSIGFVLFIFINGVQMEFSLITRMGKKAWTIAIMGLVVPLLSGFSTQALFRDQVGKLIGDSNHFVVVLVSHTVISFAVIASLLNELQIQNSELGKLALSSALVSDVLCTIVMTTGSALMITEKSAMNVVLRKVGCVFAMGVFVPLVCRPTMFWIIKHTPEGRPVKDGYIYIIIVMLFALGWVSVKIDQEFVLGAFILGLSVPEGPPLGSALVKKLNFFGTTFLLPIYVTTSMLKADFSVDYSSVSVITTCFVVLVTHFMKIISCIVPALCCNMPIRDALSLALILNSKGVVEIGLYCFLYDNRIIDGQTYGVMIVSIMVVACIVQWSVKVLYDPSRKYAGYQKRNIINLKASSELRIVACIHKPNHISSMIDVLDMCCPTTENPIIVDVLHLIELVGRALPIFIPHRGLQRQESGIHKSYSDDVILAFDIYEHDNPHAVSAYPCTAISPPNLMYEDVCNLAFDKAASIIVLPFHQRWSPDGEVESDDKNIRALNCRVLELAPCSVGILVTRASHQIRDSSTRLAMVYLGGHDDQEALCLAKRANRNPGINLVVYHLVFRADLEDVVDDDELQDVKYAHNVKYQQIIAMEGSETAAFLREIVKEHDFFIVGRRHGINSPQTDGLTNWSEFPELGVVGDFLASPDLESRASILVVQQQLSPKTHAGWLI
ncbi:Cation/H(+) antiporter 4 [Spatholobus suberectus]|nr:Cation/H(+) antiporter 4 [Spatholobus suberectus]